MDTAYLLISESFSCLPNFPNKTLYSIVDESCPKHLAIRVFFLIVTVSFKQSLSLSLMLMTLRVYSSATLYKAFPHS